MNIGPPKYWGGWEKPFGSYTLKGNFQPQLHVVGDGHLMVANVALETSLSQYKLSPSTLSLIHI